MSRDFDNIRKKIDQSHNEMYESSGGNKNQESLIKDIAEIKREVKDISFKVETMLEILNSFTIMLAEDDEDMEENYSEEGESSWIHEQDEDWNSYNDDDE